MAICSNSCISTGSLEGTPSHLHTFTPAHLHKGTYTHLHKGTKSIATVNDFIALAVPFFYTFVWCRFSPPSRSAEFEVNKALPVILTFDLCTRMAPASCKKQGFLHSVNTGVIRDIRRQGHVGECCRDVARRTMHCTNEPVLRSVKVSKRGSNRDVRQCHNP